MFLSVQNSGKSTPPPTLIKETLSARAVWGGYIWSLTEISARVCVSSVFFVCFVYYDLN